MIVYDRSYAETIGGPAKTIAQHVLNRTIIFQVIVTKDGRLIHPPADYRYALFFGRAVRQLDLSLEKMVISHTVHVLNTVAVRQFATKLPRERAIYFDHSDNPLRPLLIRTT